MTQLAALNVKITGDSADLQSDLAKAEAGVKKVGSSATVAQSKTKGFTGGLSKLSNVSGRTRAQIQNTSFQLQDIAVQLQMGTRASTVFAQQIPQLLGGFGALGAALGVVAGVGIPVLAFAFSGLMDNAQDAEEAMDDFTGSLKSATDFMRIAGTPIKDLKEEFGEFADEIQRASIVASQAALSEAFSSFEDAANPIREVLGKTVKYIDMYNAASEELAIQEAALAGAVGDTSLALSAQTFKLGLAGIEASKAAEAIGLTSAQAFDLAGALGTLDKAKTMEGIAIAAGNALDVIGSMFGATEKMPPEVARIALELQKVLTPAAALLRTTDQTRDSMSGVVDETISLTKAMEDLVEQAEMFAKSQEEIVGSQDVARQRAVKYLNAVTALEVKIGEAATDALILGGVDIASGVSAASLAAATLASNLNISLQEALKLKTLSDDPLNAFGGAGPFQLDEPPADKIAGGLAKEDPIVGELEKLEKDLMSKEELELASYERQQETLRSALEQKLLTQEEYAEYMENAAKQHSGAMAGISVYRHGETLAKTGQFLGDMASAMQSGNNKMLRIARVFGAAEALINSYRAYTQVIADPSLPWFAKIPAALSVLASGIGMVNSIKGVSSSGGGSVSAGGGAASSVPASGGSAAFAPAATGATQTSSNVVVNLTGGDMFDRGQVIRLINSINDAIDDGAQIRVV